uniref:ORF215 n=1 Tax=Stutzerimonas stutzeri TaxID=316 RepID=Q8GEB8_STUST|nr:ORF215 [Stutzerimonas stutzeri]
MRVGQNEIKLERPLFYNNPFGLRFEIGPTEIGVWANRERRQVNENYFNASLERAQRIFDTAFTPSDDISIVYQIFSDGRRRIKKKCYVLRQVNTGSTNKIEFSDHRDLYSDNLNYKCEFWHRATASRLTVEDANINKILLTLINTDFGSRYPSIGSGECYFINHTKGLVLNLYDDRGMDVVALKKETLLHLYKTHNEWLLNYDREHIDQMFSQI